MAQQKSDDLTKQWGKVVRKAWSDEEYKKRLLATPESVLKEEGLAPAQGVRVRVVEDTSSVTHLILPAKASGQLSEADMDLVVGGRSLRVFA